MITTIASTFCKAKVAKFFLFPGQGTQEVGMLDSIPQQQRQDSIALASAVLGLDVQELVTIDQHKALNQTEITQPLLLLSHYLHFRKDEHHKTLSQQDWMIGHSLGQYSALVNAGSLSLEEGLRLVQLRGQLMKKHTTSPHGMLVIKFKPEKQEIVLEEVHKAGLEVACINTKTSIIVAGKSGLIASLSKVLRTHQAAALPLPVSTAFHCKMLEAMKEQFSLALQKTHFKVPGCTILRNYDCKSYECPTDIREGLLQQLTNPVLFQQSVQKVPQELQMIEVGHKAWISKFAREVQRESFLQSLI